jgi:peptidyl-prolyl cis-trans isomerase D
MIRLLQSEGRTKKIVLGGLLLLICISMLVYLIPSGNNPGISFGGGFRQGVVAVVAGEEVTADEVQKQTDTIVRQQFPKGGAMLSQVRPFFADRAFNMIVDRKAVVAKAHDLGLRVNDQELADELQNSGLAAELFPGGKFIGKDQYEQLVSQNFNMTIQEFENEEKDFLLIRKLRGLVSGAATVTDAEVQAEYLKRNTKVKFDYAVLTTADIKKNIHPAEAELKAYYEKNKGSYANAIREKRKLRYVVIDVTKIQPQVSHADLLAYYQQHAEEYRVPEQVKVRHVLVKTPPAGADGKVDQKAVDAAKAKAADLLKQLKAGADFARLAEKNSDDPGSAKNGGDLGWIQRGRTVPEFEKTAFSLNKGQTSDLVQSSFGFHIIQSEDKQTAHLQSLDEVKDKIEPVLARQIATRQADAQSNSLLSEARSKGLDKAAAAHNLNLVATDFVGNMDPLPGIGISQEFAAAAFAAREKAPAEMAATQQGYVIFDVQAIQPPSTPTFDQIRAQVEDQFKNERATAQLALKTQELSDRARAAHDLKKAAKELGATLKTSELVLPTSQVPDIGALTGDPAVAFTMKPGEISGPLHGGANGVVLAIVQRQDPTAQEIAAGKDQVRDDLMQRKRGEAFNAFVTNLRQTMEKSGKIRVNETELKILTGRGTEGGL